jgi:hypothetical protein
MEKLNLMEQDGAHQADIDKFKKTAVLAKSIKQIQMNT